MENEKVVIVDVVRTPWGKPGGSLEKFMSSDLAAATLKKLLARTGIAPSTVDQVVFGQAHLCRITLGIMHG
jgi:acetyl-CoA acetyltransferase